MKVGDLVKFKYRAVTTYPQGVAIVVGVDPRPGCDMCTLVGSFTGGKPEAYLMKNLEVINENR